MASACSILSLFVLGILAISAARATDSEVVEAVTDGPPSVSGPNESAKMKMETTWNASGGSMQVQPYNILEANCPEGYVLANKHCHKRV